MKEPEDAGTWQLAVSRVRELGRHAEELGIEVSLEMYEDTYLGTADSSVRFVQEVGLANVGINADLGNLIRLHRPVEHWAGNDGEGCAFCQILARQNYKPHRKIRHPASSSPIRPRSNSALSTIGRQFAWRWRMASDSPFLCEHYGGDAFPSAPPIGTI